MALAAISEGFCPEHGTRLEAQPEGGWCPRCGHWCPDCGYQGAWYRAEGGDTAVAAYPPVHR